MTTMTYNDTLQVIKKLESNIQLMILASKRNCPNCVFFNLGSCNKWQSTIPWEVIPEACEEWQDKMEIPLA